MPQRNAATVDAGALPIVDVSGLTADGEARAAVGRAIRAACLDKGFMYVVGHGVDPALRAAVFEQAAAFFALSDVEKRAVDMTTSTCNRGYEAMRAQTLEAGAPPDLKEGYYIGVHLELDHPKVLAGTFNCGPNLWPARPAEFRPVMEAYHAEMTRLGARMMRGLALSLDLDEGYFDDFCVDPEAGLRLLHYPPQPADAAPNEKGAGAHTDWGALTLLMQDDAGGLQVLDEQHGWIHAPPIPDAYVVNLGDMIARWTNGLYRSTMHRVVNMSGGERYSVPFFYSGNPDHVVACLPGCLGPDEAPKYEPTTVSGHMREMYARTYA